MRERLNLTQLQVQVEAERDREARLARQKRVLLFTLLAIAMLVLSLNLPIWIFPPLSILPTAGLLYAAFLLRAYYQGYRYANPRVEETLKQFLTEGSRTHQIVLPPTTGYEVALFALAVIVGSVFLHGYREAGIPLTIENIVRDVSIAPTWAVPFILSWTIVIALLVWWALQLWRSKSFLKRANSRQLSSYLRIVLGLAIIFGLMIFGVWADMTAGQSALLLIGLLLLSSSALSTHAQRFVIRRWVNPMIMSGRYDLAWQRLRRILSVFPHELNLRYTEALLLTLTGRHTEAERQWQRWLEMIQFAGAKSVNIALIMWGYSLHRLGRHDEGVHAMEAAIELYPIASMGYLQLAGLLLDSEQEVKYALELARFGLSVIVRAIMYQQ